jgi:hypothetical protein
MTQPITTQTTEISITDLITIAKQTPVSTGRLVPANTVYDYIAVKQPAQYPFPRVHTDEQMELHAGLTGAIYVQMHSNI